VRTLASNKESYLLLPRAQAKIASEADFARVLTMLKDEQIARAGATLGEIPFYYPVPSGENKGGYAGHTGIHETLVVTPTLRESLRRGSTRDALALAARHEGMLTLLQDGIYQAARGTTSLEEVLRAVS
jgi:type II secretory ATPase GspE/PulE/Tfp pilus assembly ATPase PilB-like protein